MKKILLLLALFPSLASAVSIVSDAVDPATSQCGVFMDALPKVTVPVTVQGATKICKYDLAPTFAPGTHTVTMTAITVNDPVWGNAESAKSTPLVFTKPGVPAAPGNLGLSP